MVRAVLVRYGAAPEVARFADLDTAVVARGDAVVVRTHRGLQFGQVLEPLSENVERSEFDFVIERLATSDDRSRHQSQLDVAAQRFDRWRERIHAWGLALELIDLEQTLDGDKTILYVLADRGPDCTKLALLAAANGAEPIEVQPVGPEGLIRPELSGGGGCGTGGCGCSH